MDALAQVGQSLRRVGGFGNRVQRNLHRLGMPARGDVAGHGDSQLVFFRPARGPHDGDQLAVLAHIAVFEMQLRVAVHDAPGRGQRALAVDRRHEVDHRPANQFLRRITENALAGSADENEAPVDVDRADRVEQQVDETGRLVNRRCCHLHLSPESSCRLFASLSCLTALPVKASPAFDMQQVAPEPPFYI